MYLNIGKMQVKNVARAYRSHEELASFKCADHVGLVYAARQNDVSNPLR
jgi:hypothetical protein